MKKLRKQFVEFWHNSASVGPTLGGLKDPVTRPYYFHSAPVTNTYFMEADYLPDRTFIGRNRGTIA